MKDKRIPLLLFAMFLTSCSCAASHDSASENSNPSTSVESPKALHYDATLPEVEDDGYVLEEKNYIDYPTDLNETTGLTYELSEDETYYKVSGKTSFYGDVLVIPSFYKGLPVKEIVSDAFAEKVRLKEVYIPETIEKFGAGVFNSTPALEKIYYNAKNAEDFAGKNWVFLPVNNATNKIDVYFGPSVERIPSRLFLPLSTEPDRVPAIQNVYFSKESKLKSIGEYAFYKASEAILHDLPDTLEYIENYAFYEMKTENIDLSTSLKSIGKFAFSFNESLKHVNFHDNLEVISDYSFYNCTSLLKADLSTTKITELSDSAFRDCESLNSVIFSETLTKIDNRAFQNAALKVVDLPNNLTSIGENAFANCESLTAIKLNEKLKTINKNAFAGAVNVTKLVVYSVSLDDFEAGNNIFASLGKNKEGLEVIFMNTVKVITQRMFFPNANEDVDPNIKRIVILKSLEEIRDYALFELNVEKIDYEGSQAELQNIKTGNNILTNVECYNN